MSKPRSRGWRVSTNQAGVPHGRKRFEFDTYLSKTRYRHTVILPPSLVEAAYKSWLRDILEAGSREPKHKLTELLDAFLSWYKASHTGEHTVNVERQLTRFGQFFQNRYADDIHRRDLESYLSCRLGEVSPVTVNRDLSSVSMFFRWMIKNELYHRSNPAVDLKLPEHNEREISLEPSQVREVLELAYQRDPQFGLAVSFAILAGLRRGEAMALRWENISGKTLTLRASTTKAHKRRTVVIPDFFAHYLESIRAQGPVFGGYTSNDLRRHWESLRNTLSFTVSPGILRYHDLRHVHGDLLRRAGVPLDLVAEQLGHADPTLTLNRYAQVSYGLEDKIEGVAGLLELSTFGQDKPMALHESGKSDDFFEDGVRRDV